MQVVPDGVPIRAIDMPTERIVDRRLVSERRKVNERRKPRLELEAPVDQPIDPWQTRTTPWNRVAVISVATFACGVLLTIAVDRLTRPARAKVIAPSEHVTAAAPMTPPAPAVPAVVVQPLPPPTAELPAPPPAVSPAPASSPDDLRSLRPRTLHAVAKAPAVRPPRPAAAKPPAAAPVKAIETPPARPTRKWVDPFAG